MANDGSQEQKKVIEKAQKEGGAVHLAALMDKCHLKNSELKQKLQKYRGRAVLRVEVVKDDPGSYAVFTEQGSSASQMTAAKGSGRCQTSWMRRTSKRRRIRLHPSQNGETLQHC